MHGTTSNTQTQINDINALANTSKGYIDNISAGGDRTHKAEFDNVISHPYKNYQDYVTTTCGTHDGGALSSMVSQTCDRIECVVIL